MLPKGRNKSYILDMMHRGFVNTCIAISIGASCIIAYKGYEYFRYIRPVRKQLQQKAEEDLLMEGRHLQDTANALT